MIKVEKDFEKRLIEFRHHLHKFPELSYHEFKTTEEIIGWFERLGLPPVNLDLETGAVFDIVGEHPGPVIALRADIDALPMQEDNVSPYRSSVDGVMHACGHDMHTTALLGAGALLLKNRDLIKGTVRLLFQPAEEVATGAKYVCEKGALDGVDAIFGFHNIPTLPLGTIGIKSGGLMAGVDRFEVVFHGRGGHAGVPHKTIDPIIIAAEYVTNIQSIISRRINLFDNAAISVTHIEGGSTWNIIPDHATIEGTVRTFQKGSRKIIPLMMKKYAYGIAEANDGYADFHWEGLHPVVDNDPTFRKPLEDLTLELGYKPVEAKPSSGGEDFSFYQEQIPGFFVFIGVEGSEPWHSPIYNMKDSALKIAVEFLANVPLAISNHEMFRDKINIE